MWPWAHAAFGYLLYTGVRRVRGAGPPAGWPVVALAVGTQFPDLVDKPLAWYVQLLPYGRSLAHSLLVAVPLALGAWLYAHHRGRPAVGLAFAVGYLSHLVGDALHATVAAEWAHLAFLVWPLVPIPNQDTELEGLVAHLRDIEASPFLLFGLLVTAVGLAVWIRHGRPGVAELRGGITSIGGAVWWFRRR